MTFRALKLPTKKDNPLCSCVDGHYECGFCRGIKRQRIWSTMSAEQQAYDRYVDPVNSAVLDACSCHINPPCSFCTRDSDEPA